jgi:hypothetical protein
MVAIFKLFVLRAKTKYEYNCDSWNIAENGVNARIYNYIIW